MEKSKNRQKYLAHLTDISKKIDINETILEKLVNHEFFSIYEERLKITEDIDSNAIKWFILLELSRERATCAALIGVLRECGQIEVADILEKYNTSSGPMELSTKVELKVVKTISPKFELSKVYNLMKNPRGMCLIINNVEEQQSPDVYEEGNYIFTPKGLKSETLRFENVFTQLHFRVEVKTKLSAEQMRTELTEISKRQTLENDEAFVLIVISHGKDKQVLGYNACEAIRRYEFTEERDKITAALDAIELIKEDVIKVKDIVSIFSQENCPQLKCRPKLFFFICCREGVSDNSDKKYVSTEPIQIESGEISDLFGKDEKLEHHKEETFVSYSCAQGCQSNFNNICGMSYFGLAFTQSIAQYACDESLLGIMSRTSSRLKTIFEVLKQKEEKFIKEYNKNVSEKRIKCLTIGSFAIQVNTYDMGRQLFFNPGYFDKSISNLSKFE